MIGHKQILVADDDNDDVELFKDAVKECLIGTEVTAVANGRELLAVLEKGLLPDLIVLDLNMPFMNGYDCLAAIRKNKKYDNIPIMILSTSSLEHDLEYCLRNGATFYAVKPSTFNELKELVNRLCTAAMTKELGISMNQ